MTNPKTSPKKTRTSILNYLKMHGPNSAPNIATHLNLTSMAIRLHLYDLAAEGLLSYSEQKSKRGRPAKYWYLTDNAQEVFPDAHQSLAVDILNSVTQSLGQAGLESVISTHSQNQLSAYKTLMKGEKSLSGRVQKLAEIRTQEGYMASARQDGEAWLLAENHCPICSAARTCTQLCANELWVFQELLGRQVKIKREEHILAGARRCLYRVSPAP